MIAFGRIRHDHPIPVELRGLPYANIPPHGELAPGSAVDIVCDSALLGFGSPGTESGDWYLLAPLGSPLRGWVKKGEVVRLPVLMSDSAHQDHGQRPNFAAVYAARWAVVGIKMSEGTSYAFEAWGVDNWKRVAAAAGPQFGESRFRLGYHYGRLTQDPVKNARYHLAVVDKAGGRKPGCDVVPVLDVERSENQAVTDKKEITAWMTAFIAEIRRQSGLPTLVYGGEYLRAAGIHPVTDCGAIGGWVAEYGPHLKDKVWKELAYTRHDDAVPGSGTLFGWQYDGDTASGAIEDGGTDRLPYDIADFGHGDSTEIFVDDFVDFRKRWCVLSVSAPARGAA